MEYRTLGRTGINVSPICLGTMNFGGATDKETALQIIDHAIDHGINFIDTANSYNGGQSEEITGQALRRNKKRDQVILATKFYNPMSENINDRGVSRLNVVKACESSLQRLDTEVIDLYQIHRPGFEVPQDETLRALEDLVRAGKIRYFGTSNFPAWFIMEGLAVSEKNRINRFVSEQPPYNLLDRRVENELIPLCIKYNIALLPWSPLAGGILAGRYESTDDRPENSKAARGKGGFGHRITQTAIDVARQLQEMAKERNMHPAALSLLWLKDQPGVTSPIVGPRTLEHFKVALSIAEMTLDPNDRDLFDKLVSPGSFVSDFHSSSNWMKKAE
ncbi:MAG: aldo/keto reductase [Spirochaetales bacterium]|nr:aldo/keto reductase [Spirochaetales bacterium]